MLDFDPVLVADEIERKTCALLVGPDLFRLDGRPLNQAMRDSLAAKYGAYIEHYYEQQGLFKFKHEAGKKLVTQKAVREFYEAATPDEELLKKIASIPFHLILSINPDTYLSDTFLKYGIRHQFHYFLGNHREVKPVEPPAELPLIYNLTGTKDKYDSLVLDYDDLYDYFKSVFGPPGLPQHLHLALNECSSFLFLGFQLDKWYTQLFVRWVSDVKGARRYANTWNGSAKDPETEQFIQKHINIYLTEKDSFGVLDDLYRIFQDNGTLRLLSPSASPNTVGIRRRVQNGEMQKALEEFNALSGSVGEQNAATLFLSEYNDLVEKKSKYALNSEEFEEHLRKLKFRLLETLDKYATTL